MRVPHLHCASTQRGSYLQMPGLCDHAVPEQGLPQRLQVQRGFEARTRTACGCSGTLVMLASPLRSRKCRSIAFPTRRILGAGLCFSMCSCTEHFRRAKAAEADMALTCPWHLAKAHRAVLNWRTVPEGEPSAGIMAESFEEEISQPVSVRVIGQTVSWKSQERSTHTSQVCW